MTRKYKYSDRADIKSTLNTLIAPDVAVDDYQKAMYQLGLILADELRPNLDPNASYCIASTAEDADFLSKGILEGLKDSVSTMKLACFWNYHSSPLPGGESTAPIIRKFIETGAESCDHLIIAKSVISGSCVVKTNITSLIETMTPNQIYVVAPVMHTDAQSKLRKEFPEQVADKFQFETLAIDSIRDSETHEVVPGIGGDVYQHLGFMSQKHKNQFTPSVVTQRLFA